MLWYIDIELVKKLNHFNIYAYLGFQFDGNRTNI